MTTRSLLARLEGSELAQVWFVRDYLQLIFEGVPDHWSWQCYVWPRVEVDGLSRGYRDQGYRDALCSLIGKTVVSTRESESSGLSISFETAAITLNPTSDELVGPEIAMLHLYLDRGEWMVWRPGEDSFAHLK